MTMRNYDADHIRDLSAQYRAIKREYNMMVKDCIRDAVKALAKSGEKLTASEISKVCGLSTAVIASRLSLAAYRSNSIGGCMIIKSERITHRRFVEVLDDGTVNTDNCIIKTETHPVYSAY